MTGLWCHSQQRQQVYNCILKATWSAKLCFGHVLTHSLSAHLMQVKLLLVTFYLNGELHAVSIKKPSERMPSFWTVRSLKPNTNRISVFRTSLFMATLKAQSNGQLWLYNNAVIGTLAVDGWDVTFGTTRRGLGGLRPHPVPFSLYQNVTAHPSTAGVPTSYYLMWHYNCLWTLKG